MNCREAEKMVVPYIKDKLTIDELDDFLEHVEDCGNCMEELEIHYMVDVGLRKLDEDDTVYDIDKLLFGGFVQSRIKLCDLLHRDMLTNLLEAPPGVPLIIREYPAAPIFGRIVVIDLCLGKLNVGVGFGDNVHHKLCAR